MVLFLRKADLAVQCTIGALMVILIPIGGLLVFALGLVLLGAVQLLSALLNTPTFIHAGFKKQITIYWCLAVLSLLLVFSNYLNIFLPGWNTPVWFTLVGVLTGMFLAVYYAIQYRMLIRHLALRNELSGFTKSKF